MKVFYGYVRVSTPKQGLGVSLQEQRAAIEAFSARQGARISEWFVVRETAAHRGRPVFGRMLRLLRARRADGVVMHKIDRSARNLKDWADLGELIDSGTEMHFATESLDLGSRGGRLSADIQAVVAADYIRNLREETRKGFYGRLKQGLYPLRAPVGYLDRGRGQRKEIDPRLGPLVKRAFELYATGEFSLESLRRHMFGEGLVGHTGKMLSPNGMSGVLNNPFYTGVMRIRRENSCYQGLHEPLIPVELFDHVRQLLAGKTAQRTRTNAFLFRRLIRCAACGRVLTGELKKGRVYYRCHTRTCTEVCIREDGIWHAVSDAYHGATDFSDAELAEVEHEISLLQKVEADGVEDRKRTAQLHLAQIDQKLDKLTDVLIEGLIDRGAFERRKASLLFDQRRLALHAKEGDPAAEAIAREVADIFELTKALAEAAKAAPSPEGRDLVCKTVSNFWARGKNVVIELRSPFRELRQRCSLLDCDPHRGAIRTFAPVANPKPLTAKDIATLIFTSAKTAAKAADEDLPLAS
jgi:DNA invertase Pin-like site-specific DNA recombinase